MATPTLTGTNDKPTLGFYQGFEAGDAGILDGGSGWHGNVPGSNSGDGGMTTVDGGKFAVFAQGAAPDDTGPFTRFDGYRSDFVEGLTSEVKVYLNTDWATAKGSTTRLRPTGRTARICVTSSSTLPRIARRPASGRRIEQYQLRSAPGSARRCTTMKCRRAAGSRCSTCSTMSTAILSVDLNLIDANGEIVFTQTLSSADRFDFGSRRQPLRLVHQYRRCGRHRGRRHLARRPCRHADRRQRDLAHRRWRNPVP